MAEESRTETTRSSSEQVVLASGHVDLFDFVLIHDVVDGLLGDDDQLSDGVSAAAGVPHSEGELEVDPGSTSIIAKGLIDPAAGWQFYGWVDLEPVSWVLPGPRGGPFAAFDRRAFSDPEWPIPERVPVLIKLVPDDDAEIRRFVEHARQDGWTENLADRVWGWVELHDSRWHGKVQDAFPSLVDPEAVASLDRPGHHMSLDGGALLPFVLELKERGRLSLNADALGRIVLVFPYRQYRTIRNQIVGGARTGYWSGELAFRRGDCPAVVRETSTLQLHTGGPGEAVERMRADWELGSVFREARQAWLHRLPPCPHSGERCLWWRSQLHSALRRMLPGLAAQGRGDGWTDRQRTETMDEVLSIVLKCRFGLLKVPVFDEGDDVMLEKASTAVGADEDPTRDFWPLYQLGVGKIDPWSYHRLKGPWVAEFAELARRYEPIPGMWSPAVSRALVHGLLLAETGDCLDSAAVGYGSDLTGISLYDERRYVDCAQLDELLQQQGRRERRTTRRGIWKWIAGSLLGAVLGGWIGGLKGAVVGLLLGGWAADHLLQKSAAAANQTLERQLSWKMQRAVLSVSHPTVSWEEVRREMREADEAGAAWAPEAWRLVEQARRREVASRTD